MRRLIFVFLLLQAGALMAKMPSESIQSKLNDLGERGSSQVKASLYSDLGTALYKEGKMEDAAEAFESSLTFDTSRSQRQYIYVYLGKAYESSARLDKAINAYENAVLYDKRNWRRHRDLGGLYEQAELLLKAKDSYSRALELNPKEPGLFLSMGRVWRKMTLYSYALPWLEKALVSGQDIGLVQEQLSLLYEGQGQFDKAAAACEATNDDGKRLIYLALLAGNTRIVKEGHSRLTQAKVSRETRQVYENLIELLQHPPMDILAGKTSNPALQAMLKNHFSEEPNQ